MKKRLAELVVLARGLQPRVRLALAGAAVLGTVLIVATCNACRHGGGTSDPSVGSAAPGPVSTSSTAVRAAAGDAGVLDPLMWSHARTGNPESLQTLADHEGASGLIEAAEADATLRPIALRAMGLAAGWSQIAYLAKVAANGNDEEAALALDAALELGTRPRTSVDNEDVEELTEGCSGLSGIAKDGGKAKSRRVSAVRALRMMPCPKDTEIPSDVDAK